MILQIQIHLTDINSYANLSVEQNYYPENSNKTDQDYFSGDSVDDGQYLSDDDAPLPLMTFQEKFASTVKKMNRNAILQKILKNCMEKSWIYWQMLRVKTRWNNLVKSASRFLRVVDCIKNALSHKEIKSSHLWSDKDTHLLHASQI